MTNSIEKKKKKISSKQLKEWAFAYSFLAYPLILFLIFYVYINLNSFVLAFQDINLDNSRTFAGFAHFREFLEGLFSNGGLIRTSFVNSLIMYFMGLLITMPLQLLFSYMMFKECFANKLIKIIIMVPSMISGMVYSLVFLNFIQEPFTKIMQGLGVVDFPNLLNVYPFQTTLFYGIWLSFSSSLILYPNAMRSIDPAIFESAKIDGMYSMWQEMRYIILPLIFPTLSTFLVLGFANIMSDSGALIPFFRYSAPESAYNMGYYMTVQVFGDLSNPKNMPTVAAGGMILTIVVAPFTLLLNRFLNKINPMEG